MRFTVKLPKLGDTADEVLVVEWLADVGATLKEGDPLFSAETDKVEVDVPAPVAGVLVERLVKEDDEISVGTPIAILEN